MTSRQVRDGELLQSAHGSGVVRAVRRRAVLVVDDDPAYLRALVQVLGARGHDVDGELHPRRALERVVADPARFSALVTDLHMPELSGVELAAAVRSVAPAMAIVLHSGQVSRALRRWAVDAVVPKHAGVDALLRELDRVAADGSAGANEATG